ncbi:MAG: ABC transporter ATP-binding protein [Blastocatellia bacterium]|nr:MAG: ABC transporter ATP-binding protein [Blastocatellia bacterium]
MSQLAIQVRSLSKRYRIGGARRRHATLTEGIMAHLRALGRWRSSNDDTFWALSDVSFDVKRGDVIGFIGPNGAGKSTLLKVLSRITRPTTGTAEIWGRVSSLLEVGTGFHPELSGRENVYLNGAILGMRKAEIDRQFDEIVEFSGVSRFIDTPVKRYSSGMYLRLAFAVAAHLTPEILIVDEVLAVGDLAFQRKCLGKINNVARQGQTVLFVSHNMAAIESLCNVACLLVGGRIVVQGMTREVIDAYLRSVPLADSSNLADRQDRQGSGKLRCTDLTCSSPDGLGPRPLQCGRDAEFSVAYVSDSHDLRHVSIEFVVSSMTGECMLLLNSNMTGVEFEVVPSTGRIRCLIRRLPLTPGQYSLNIYCVVEGVLADWVQQAALLTVEPGDFFGTGQLPQPSHGGMLVEQFWEVDTLSAEPAEALRR